jgi:hypothetical protein
MPGVTIYRSGLGPVLFGGFCFSVVIGFPVFRSTESFLLTVSVFLLGVVFWSWFLQCKVDDAAVYGRDPSSLGKRTIEHHQLRELRKGRFGFLNIPGHIAIGASGERVFLFTNAITDERVQATMIRQGLEVAAER